MSWSERFELLTETDKANFRRVVNRLMAATAIVRRNEENRRDYYFIRQHEELVREFMAAGGWQLLKDEGLGVYCVRGAEAGNRVQLRMMESILLLIVRLIYEEQRGEVRLNDDALIRTADIQERYRALKIKERPIDKRTLRETLHLLERFNLLRRLDSDVTDPECRMVIFPSILFAVEVDAIRQVFERLRSYGDRDDHAGDMAADDADADDAPAEQSPNGRTVPHRPVPDGKVPDDDGASRQSGGDGLETTHGP